MRYFWVSAYNNYGDFEYYVFVDNKEEITEALKTYRDEEELTVTVHEIYGPYELGHETVICGKQPE